MQSAKEPFSTGSSLPIIASALLGGLSVISVAHRCSFLPPLTLSLRISEAVALAFLSAAFTTFLSWGGLRGAAWAFALAPIVVVALTGSLLGLLERRRNKKNSQSL